MKSTVEVRVVTVHEVEPHEQELIMTSLRERLNEDRSLSTWDKQAMASMLDSLDESMREASNRLNAVSHVG